VQVRPDAAVATRPPAVSDAQRLMLARLDADLAKAQRRLNRAETRLTEGQRQLGNFTGVLQRAMLDVGTDARGLHPFVRVAQRYLGTPYVWGGESARGFDCSGFIMRVMRDLGYQALPHSAAEQFRYGMPVSKELLKAGDIVFFANTYKPGVSHVGIYLGRGRFIHAANSKDGTIVSGLNEPKWVEKYAGARRLVRVNS
jgi:cell wall-associated NlpC family hydrolase